MNANAVKDLVSKNQFEIALEADQLKQQRMAGNAFKDFKEGSIHFFPTYKYNPGTNDWDSRCVFKYISYLKKKSFTVNNNS